MLRAVFQWGPGSARSKVGLQDLKGLSHPLTILQALNISNAETFVPHSAGAWGPGSDPVPPPRVSQQEVHFTCSFQVLFVLWPCTLVFFWAGKEVVLSQGSPQTGLEPFVW